MKKPESALHFTLRLVAAAFLLLASACTLLSQARLAPDALGVEPATLVPTASSPVVMPADHQSQIGIPLPEPSPPASPPLSSPDPTFPRPTSLPTVPLPTPLLISPVPIQTSDLLFLSGENLMRWDYVTGFSGLLVEGVSHFSVSASGRQIALLRPMKIAANGIELFNLDLLDMESMQVNALLQQTPRLGHVTISPDGGWVAYTMGSPDLTVYALPVRDTPQAVKLGACVTETDGHCEQLSWSPDGKSLAWNGAQGIWLADLSSLKTSLVHTRQVVVKDPKGENTEIDIDFLSLSWSPLGRFLLTQIALSSSDVKWLAVLDSLTGRLAQVPDTFEHRTPQTHALWLEDGLLLLAFNEGETSQPYLHIKLWQVVVTNNDLLVPRDISALIPGDFQIPVPQDLTGSSLCPKWLAQLEQGKLLLEIALPNGLSAPWLFALDLQKQALSKLYDLPNDTVDILWSPDGGGALILGGHSQIIFVPADGSPFYSLLPGLGKDAHEFQWLPPSPRT